MDVRNRSEREEDILFFSRHTNTQLPYSIIFDSGKEGPTVGFSCATHGVEPAGVVAVRSLLEELIEGRLILHKGRIVALMINPFSYLEDVRFINSNINRLFVPADTFSRDAEGFRVWEIRRFFTSLDRLDYFLDIHTVSRGDDQLLMYQHEHAKHFGLVFSPYRVHFLPYSHTMPGGLIEEVSRHFPSSSVYAIECGNNGSPAAIPVADYHVRSMLYHLGMITPRPVPTGIRAHAGTVEVYRLHSIIRPYVGFRFVIDDIDTGTFLKKGTLYATSSLGEHRSEADLYAMIPSKAPSPKDFDAGFFCTKEEISVPKTT